MHNSVVYELTVFGGAGAAGVLVAFLYDLFRLKRRMVKTKPVLVHIEDIVFWITASVILFLSSYIISSGETRIYFYAGVFLGGVLYLSIFSRPILWLLSTLIKMIVWPFYEIYKFMRPIVQALLIRLRRLLSKARNRAALEGYRMRVDFCRLRNTFTKK
jgi:spore cortex biosynthesis protein YabQ